MDKQFWNERYQADAYAYGQRANIFFKDRIESLSPGSILLPAEGEGRNAVYAASLDWSVTAFDFSTEGQRKALALAKKNDVTIHYEVTDFLSFEPNQKFDAIALIYVHMDESIRNEFHRRCIEWLKPGGTIILEAFHKNQIQYQSGGPKKRSFLYDKEMLQDDFSELKDQYIIENEIHLEEGPFHEGPGFVVRMIATK